MRLALDATYSLGDFLSGVGVYSREIMFGLAAAHLESNFRFCYRPHRFLRSFSDRLPRNAHRSLLYEPIVPRAELFHGLNQRLPRAPLIRAVSTFHDLFVITGEYSTPEFRARFESLARDAAARSDLIIAVSAFTARQLEACLGVEPSRIRVIHHGVHPPQFPPPPATARDRLILHTGATQKRKNILRLVHAFERIGGDWRLALAGASGYEAGVILETIAASPARPRIDVLGYVSGPELNRLYSRAALFAFPSLDEGFGLPVLEAMSWGVPVLTSNTSALPEIAGDAALLVDPLEIESIEHGLRRLVEKEELRRELTARGFRRVAHFTWREAVSKTWSVYSELLSQR